MSEASGRILLIEDDPMLTELYQAKLELEGFDVDICTDGKEGLARTKRLKPDLILLDIMLPEMNGFEVLRKLRENAATRRIPVIVLTNLGGEQADNDKKLALSLGAKEFLVKTFHLPDDIVGKIKAVLKNQAAHVKSAPSK
ncbi:MAG: response regulator [Patescibacteria group bacterium]